MYHDTVIAGTPVIDSTPTAGSNHAVSSGGVKSALNTVDESIAIRVSGNKTTYASGAAIGQYVIVSGSTITGIADGLYKAAKAVPYNTVIDSTYLTAVSGGGLNDLKSALNFQTITPIAFPNVTLKDYNVKKSASLAIVNFSFTLGFSPSGTDGFIRNLPMPAGYVPVIAIKNSGGGGYQGVISGYDGTTAMFRNNWDGFVNGGTYLVSVVYAVA